MILTESDKNRFWSKVDKKESHECWNWKGSLRKEGKYGNFYLDGRNYQSHRISWIISYGSIKEGMLICHKCDNKLCCNPKHLFMGNVRENNLDKLYKNRHVTLKGINSPNSKINNNDLLNIRNLLNSGMSQRKIAKLFNVSQGCIAHINKGITYKEKNE